MLNKLKKSNGEGFTIIEVMIVLAIAGLIILIVLLAVPALQRNSRNTAIKNDASALAAGFSEFESNNDGALPTTVTQPAGSATVTYNGTSPATAKIQASTTLVAVNPTQAGEIRVWMGKKCVAATPFGPQASARSVAILYFTEDTSATGLAQHCLDS